MGAVTITDGGAGVGATEGTEGASAGAGDSPVSGPDAETESPGLLGAVGTKTVEPVGSAGGAGPRELAGAADAPELAGAAGPPELAGAAGTPELPGAVKPDALEVTPAATGWPAGIAWSARACATATSATAIVTTTSPSFAR